MKCTFRFCRGTPYYIPPGGWSAHAITADHVGGSPIIRPFYKHFNFQKPQRPLRNLGGMDVPLPPVLFNKVDQIMLLERALVVQRMENQVSQTLSQLAFNIRNADEYVDKFLLKKDVRPSLHLLWFHDRGLREHQHILSILSPKQLVPLFSLLSHDVERGKMTLQEAEAVYVEIIDSTVASPKLVRREICNGMVRACALCGEYDKALEVILEMKNKDIRRTFITYAPLFRLIRKEVDVNRALHLQEFLRKTEGGSFNKFLWIDVARVFHMFFVFLRWSWGALVTIVSVALWIVVCHITQVYT